MSRHVISRLVCVSVVLCAVLAARPVGAQGFGPQTVLIDIDKLKKKPIQPTKRINTFDGLMEWAGISNPALRSQMENDLKGQLQDQLNDKINLGLDVEKWIQLVDHYSHGEHQKGKDLLGRELASKLLEAVLGGTGAKVIGAGWKFAEDSYKEVQAWGEKRDMKYVVNEYFKPLVAEWRTGNADPRAWRAEKVEMDKFIDEWAAGVTFARYKPFGDREKYAKAMKEKCFGIFMKLAVAHGKPVEARRRLAKRMRRMNGEMFEAIRQRGAQWVRASRVLHAAGYTPTRSMPINGSLIHRYLNDANFRKEVDAELKKPIDQRRRASAAYRAQGKAILAILQDRAAFRKARVEQDRNPDTYSLPVDFSGYTQTYQALHTAFLANRMSVYEYQRLLKLWTGGWTSRKKGKKFMGAVSYQRAVEAARDELRKTAGTDEEIAKKKHGRAFSQAVSAKAKRLTRLVEAFITTQRTIERQLRRRAAQAVRQYDQKQRGVLGRTKAPATKTKERSARAPGAAKPAAEAPREAAAARPAAAPRPVTVLSPTPVGARAGHVGKLQRGWVASVDRVLQQVGTQSAGDASLASPLAQWPAASHRPQTALHLGALRTAYAKEGVKAGTDRAEQWIGRSADAYRKKVAGQHQRLLAFAQETEQAVTASLAAVDAATDFYYRNEGAIAYYRLAPQRLTFDVSPGTSKQLSAHYRDKLKQDAAPLTEAQRVQDMGPRVSIVEPESIHETVMRHTMEVRRELAAAQESFYQRLGGLQAAQCAETYAEGYFPIARRRSAEALAIVGELKGAQKAALALRSEEPYSMPLRMYLNHVILAQPRDLAGIAAQFTAHKEKALPRARELAAAYDTVRGELGASYRYPRVLNAAYESRHAFDQKRLYTWRVAADQVDTLGGAAAGAP
jgi:hypothetical protein